MPEDKRVPWDRYPQAIWEEAIERYDQQEIRGIPLSQKPIPPWLPLERKVAKERQDIDDATYLYNWGWKNWNALIRVNWALYPQAIWKKAIARCEQRKPPRAIYPDKTVPPPLGVLSR